MKFLQIVPPDTKFDFVGKFKYCLPLSLIAMGFVVVLFFTKGLNYGVDFTGGTSIQVKLPQAMSAEQVRALMTEFNAADVSVVALGSENREYLLTSRTVLEMKGKSPLQQKLEEKFGAGIIQAVDVVGPRVGKELKWAALQSLFYSLLLIMVYIWFRFDFRFAPGATIALVHDLLMAVGFYLLTGREFNITAVAALLTIAGYGVNDTIVIYDHVREMIRKRGGKGHLTEIINEAINLTLSRTVATALLVFLSLIPIAIICEGELEDFALAMLVGVAVGSYTTFFIAAPITVIVEKLFAGREGSPLSHPSTVGSR